MCSRLHRVFQSEACNSEHLSQRFLVLDIAPRGQPAFQRAENISLRAPLHRVQEREAELLAIRRIQLLHALELRARERIETGPRLLALRCVRHVPVRLKADTTGTVAL